jgi:hypothetical protein
MGTTIGEYLLLIDWIVLTKINARIIRLILPRVSHVEFIQIGSPTHERAGGHKRIGLKNLFENKPYVWPCV